MVKRTLSLLSVAICILGLAINFAACGPANTGTLPNREFGIVADPWQELRHFTETIGIAPTAVMIFEPWSNNRTLSRQLAATKDAGLNSYFITWEPWEPTPFDPNLEQGAPQPEYSNRNIAQGRYDQYIRNFARAIRDSHITVYIRYAHEMNVLPPGNWYPWSNDPDGFRDAWKHVVDIFRQERALNAKFIFSFNPNLYQDDVKWENAYLNYWPGIDQVDYIGFTMINFGGNKNYTVERFGNRIDLVHGFIDKPVIITELQTEYVTRVQWLTDFYNFMKERPWIAGAVLSQSYSRAAINEPGIGDTNWRAEDDVDTQPIIRQIIQYVKSR